MKTTKAPAVSKYYFLLLKILKSCSGISDKFAFEKNKTNGVESMEEVRAAIKDIIQYRSLSGKFSSVHSDLAAEGITRWGRKDPFFSQKKDSDFLNVVRLRNGSDQ